MQTRTTILALAALTVTSLSALAPTSASAWGMHGGYGSAHRFGSHFGGYRPMSYFRPSYRPHIWASAPQRPYTSPVYRPYVTYSAPTYLPVQPTRVVQPAEEHCEDPAMQSQAPQRRPY